MSPLVDELDRTRRTRSLVEELIADPGRLGPDLQPVRRVDATGPGEVVAWKATGRGQPGTELADTLALLAGAASLGLVERLDWAFRVLVLDTVVAAGLTEPVHLTPEPETFGGACPPRLAVAFGRGRRGRRRGACGRLRRPPQAHPGPRGVPGLGVAGRARRRG
jgi:hypothetical protein